MSRAKVDLSSMNIPRAKKGEAAPVVAAPETAPAPEWRPPRPAFLDRPTAGQAAAAMQQPDVPAAEAPEVSAASRAGAGEGTPTSAPDLAPRDPEPPARQVPDTPPQPVLVPRKARNRGEPRSPVTTRLTYSLQDRLFHASTVTGKSQQTIIEEALDAFLKKQKL